MLSSKSEKKISGSICKIESAFIDDLLSILYFPANNSMSLTFKEGKSFTEDYFAPGTAQFTPKNDPSDQGDRYSFEISWQVAGLDASRTINLAVATKQPIILRITDNNGSRMIIPYCFVKFGQNIGQNHNKFTGHSIVVNASLSHPAPMDMSFGSAIPSV